MRTFLRTLSTTSGFLQNSPVEFSPNLNCIIGARGTCKSTLIESIRFAFDHDSERVRELQSMPTGAGHAFSGMLRSTLGPGTVRCELTVEDGAESTSVVLERELDAAPRIYIDNVREHTDQAVLQHIEIFSQGDLQRIAEDPNDDMRLKLIDRPNSVRIRGLLHERAEAGLRLIVVGGELRALRAQIAALRQEIQPAPELREQLRQVEAAAPQLTPELEGERVSFEDRRRVSERMEAAVDLQRGILLHLSEINGYWEQLQSIRRDLELSAEPEARRVDELLDLIAVELGVVQSATRAISTVNLSSEQETLRRTFEGKNELFYRLRQEQHAVNESLKQQQTLRKQIEFLERRRGDLERAQRQESSLLTARQAIRDRLAALDNDIFLLRIGEVEAVNAEHGDRVHLTLQSDVVSANQRRLLSEMLGGSRIRAQEEVATALASTFAAADLVDLVEAGSSQQIAQILNRDLGQINRVVAHLADHPDLYRLEALTPQPKLEITMFDEGIPKPVESLSKGQKATALLPLILRPLPYPLLFDQPEDDLDNSFIFRSLIRTVISLKPERQVIFVTHNANIPVLGSAEKVIVMSMRTPQEANPPLEGSVDECKQQILELLEGGADAFRMREMKYHDLLVQR